MDYLSNNAKGTTSPRVEVSLPKPGLGHLGRGGGVKIFFLGLPKEQSSQPDCETESLTEEKRRKGTEIGQGCGYNEESMNTGLFFVFISIHSWYVIVHRFYMG